jgi:hypothetical protein
VGKSKNVFANLLALLGVALYSLSGLILWIFMAFAFVHWWGVIGIVASFIFTPGIVVFGFIFWLVEHRFPVEYFVVWAIGIVGLIIASISKRQ